MTRRSPGAIAALGCGPLVHACLAVSLGACGRDDAGVRWNSRDSAGVQIVSIGGNAPRWTVSERTTLELGSVDDPGPSSFYRVQDVELLPDGGLVVANQGSEELRFFTADGTHRTSVGGEGHGPTEFDGLSMIESFGDSLLAWDAGNQRISVRLVDGTPVRTFQLEWFDGILFPADLLGAAGITGRRGILAVTARYMSQLEGTGLVIDTALISVYDMDGALTDSLVRLPHNARVVQRVGDLQTTLGAPYHAGAALVGVADGFCYTFGAEPEIQCHDRARLRRIFRMDLPARSVTEADVASFWEEALETTSDRRRSALRRMRDVMPFPDIFPAFAQLLRDDRDRIWARRYRTPHETAEEWVVLDEGRWVGRLAAPVGFQMMDVRGDRIAGVWQDELGVEFVRVYEYRTP